VGQNHVFDGTWKIVFAILQFKIVPWVKAYFSFQMAEFLWLGPLKDWACSIDNVGRNDIKSESTWHFPRKRHFLGL
jgi:hypothetical protein